MKLIQLNARKIEILLYGLVWLLVFSISVFNGRNLNTTDWDRIIREWIHLLWFLFIFLINVFVLVPQLLFKKKYLYYLAASISIILIVIGVQIILQSRLLPIRELSNVILPNVNIVTPPPKPLFMVIIDNFIIAILMIGTGTASQLVSKWLNEEKLRKDIEKEQLKTNLALLRHQVSPHFFMNTLNNIHALIDINPEDAKDSIIRLSTLMRYLLYDSAQNKINFQKEMEFINSFITLMRLRFSDKVHISVIVPEQIPDIQISPMLFISFLENAFKHGVSYQSESFIFFEIKVFEKFLQCTIKNSKHLLTQSQYGEYSGIGLDNIKKSLKLLYNEDFKLIVLDKENEFEINLTIPL